MSESPPATCAGVDTAPRKTMWLWGVGTVADAVLICSFALVFPIFNTGFGLPAEWLSWALMIPRLFDGLLGPFIGYWSDNTHTRWGRRKPFLVASGAAGALVFAGLWWASPEWSKPAQFGYVVLFGTLYYTTWGIYSMTHNALGYELTDDYHERSRVMAIRNIFLQVITLGVGWIYPLALQPFFGGEIHGIRVISAVLAVVIFASMMFPVLSCRERFTVAKQKPTPIFKALGEALRIPSFRIYLAMRFCAMFGLVVFNQLIFYINVYHVFGGAEHKKAATTLIAMATALTVGVTLAALPMVPKLSMKLGKRKGVIIGAAVAVLQACLVPFLYTPDSPVFRLLADWFPGLGIDSKSLSPYLQLLAALLLMPLFTVSVVLRDAIVPDICDVDELGNGQRREGLFTAVVNFVYKMEVSLCVVLVGYMLKLSGFDQKAAVQTAEVITNLKWCAYLPNILFAVLALVLAIRFPITEEFMAKVHERLAQRRKNQAGP